MKQALAVVAFAVLATKAVALDMAAIEACTEIEADKARLACFDIAVVAQAPQTDQADTTALADTREPSGSL